MTALTTDRSTPERGVEMHEFPPAPGVAIFRGALVGIDAGGFARPAGSVAGLLIVGRAETSTRDYLPQAVMTEGALPSGIVSAGPDPSIRVRRGRAFAWANSPGADAITAADFGKLAYAVDDQTVAKTDGGTGRAVAGTIRGVDAGGVWVQPA